MAASLSDVTPPESPAAVERRLGRWNVDAPVHLETAHGASPAVIRNISIFGMFVAIPRPLEAGARVVVRLEAPVDDEPVEIRAEVRWSRAAPDGADRPAGIGLRYTDPLWEVARFVGIVLRRRSSQGSPRS